MPTSKGDTMAAKRSTRKSGEKSGEKRPGTFAKGRDPRQGRGPKPGAPNAGRPPNWFKDWCAEILAKPETIGAVEAVIADPSHGAFAAMWKAVADRAHGKPVQPVDVTGNITVGLANRLKQARERAG